MGSRKETLVSTQITWYAEDFAKIGGTGVLGLEYASSYWNLCSAPEDILVLLVPHSTIRINGTINYRGIPSDINLDECTEIYPNLYVTNKEQTICDMIEYGTELRMTLETIQGYLEDDNKNIDKLESMLKDRGIYEEYLKLKEESEELDEEY